MLKVQMNELREGLKQRGIIELCEQIDELPDTLVTDGDSIIIIININLETIYQTIN